MVVRIEDVEGNQGGVSEDLTLEDYDGPDLWRVRIEDTLDNLDSEAQKPLHDLESVEGNECLAKLVDILPTYPLIESAEVIEE